jgi:hypothetical protein
MSAVRISDINPTTARTGSNIKKPINGNKNMAASAAPKSVGEAR